MKTTVEQRDVEVLNFWCTYLSSLGSMHSFLHLRVRINLKNTEKMLSKLMEAILFNLNYINSKLYIFFTTLE